ncbi:MAG TPA: FHA domain-containing protein [Acidobacteriota bacterium]|nr:FHA domain-containing protein [Acidobacteriota bacterium]
MSARLFCKSGPLAGQECLIKEEATIGTHQENGLVLTAPDIAQRHARIRYDGEMGCYLLENLSQAGLALDGEAVAESVPLQGLHVITLARQYDFFFQWTGEAPRRDEAASSAPRQAPPRPAREEPGEKTLFKKIKDVLSPPRFQPSEKPSSQPSVPASDDEQLVTQPLGEERPGEQTNAGPLRGAAEPPSFGPSDDSAGAFVLELETLKGVKTFPLREGENDVGRSKRCRISVKDATISRRHAIIKVESGSATVVDLDSMNKTYIDEHLIEAETEVKPDVPLRFGRLKGRIRREKE